MSLHDDLLALARRLAGGEPPPGEANLRRAVSTSYYALYHLLVDAATRRMFGADDDRAALRHCVARAFGHANMLHVARSFAGRGKGKDVSPKLAPGLEGRSLQPELVRVAQAFVDLRQARHDADYDLARRFTGSDVLDLVERAEGAFEDWAKIQGSVQADVFMAGLIAFGNIRT